MEIYMYMYIYHVQPCWRCAQTSKAFLQSGPVPDTSAGRMTYHSSTWTTYSRNHSEASFSSILGVFACGKIGVFFCQTSASTASHKYWSATDKVCVSIPPFTSSLKSFWRCCTIGSLCTSSGNFLVGIVSSGALWGPGPVIRRCSNHCLSQLSRTWCFARFSRVSRVYLGHPSVSVILSIIVSFLIGESLLSSWSKVEKRKWKSNLPGLKHQHPRAA